MDLVEQLQGSVYLVQPDTLIGINRYKIGLTKQNDFSSLQSYGKNRRVLCIRGCNNSDFILNKIKESFKQIFKLIARNEYFEGDEISMIDTFNKIVNDNEYNIDASYNNKNKAKPVNKLNDKILKKSEVMLKGILNAPPDNIIFNAFIHNNIEADPESKIKLGRLYHVFKIWYSKCGSSKRLPQRRDLKKAMNKRFGEYATLWNGFAIKKQIYKNEDEDDDIIFFNK